MIARLARALGRCSRGVAAVEFALVAPPLLLFVFGILEFGLAEWDRNALQEAAMAAARCEGVQQGSTGSTAACGGVTPTAYAEQIAQDWGITVPNSGVAITANTSCGGVAGFSQVTLSYTFVSAVPQLIGVFQGGIPLSATACFPRQP